MTKIITIPFNGQPSRPKPVCLLNHLSRRHVNQFAPYKPGDVIQVDQSDGTAAPYIVQSVKAHRKDGWWQWEIQAAPAPQPRDKKSNMQERI